MQLEQLRISNFRKITCAEIHPSSGLNFFLGKNGSGKTSILEAIYVLHAGKSFRSKISSDLISLSENSLVVSGRIASKSGTQTTIRVNKSRETSTYSIDGRHISSASELAISLPLLLVNSDSFEVISGSPRIRRSMLDRTLFHVEPAYLKLLAKFNEATKNRTSLLKAKADRRQMLYWDQEFLTSGLLIHQARLDCVNQLNQKLNVRNLRLGYVPGWKSALSLHEALYQDRAKDLATGRINSGPQKAGISIDIEQQSASRYASRGQLKVAIFAIMEAISDYILSIRGSRPIFLVDDVSSELDADAQTLVLHFLVNTQAQTFITALSNKDFEFSRYPTFRMFHVEQGLIRAF